MQSPQVSTTTPRTSRRLTSGAPLGSLQTPSRPPLAPPSFPPLSHLNLRPYNSHPYAVDLTFTTKLQEDRQAIDYAVQSTQQSLSNKKRDLQASLTEIDEERRRLEQATKGLGEQAKQLGEKQKQDLEEQRQHKLKRGQVEAATRDLQSQIEGVMLEIKEEQKKLAARRDSQFSRYLSPRSVRRALTDHLPSATTVKARHREQFQSQLNKTAPELAFFEDKLGLRIRGIGSQLSCCLVVHTHPTS